jgi:hypothetical protein
MIYLAGAIIVSLILFAFLGFDPKKNTWKRNRKQYFAFLGLIVVSFGLFTTVQGNEVGIVYNPLQGGIQDESFGEGLHFKAPWVRVYRISTKLREEGFEMTAQTGKIMKEISPGVFEETGGGQWATYDVTFQYRVRIADAHRFYRNFGGNEASVETLQARIQAALQENSVKYDVFSILKGGIIEVREGTFQDLILSMEDLGITVENFIIRDVDAGPAIEKVVEEEATAAKQAEIAVKEQEAALIREETIRLQAVIQADRILITANAEATAQIILNSVTVNAIVNMYLGQFEQGQDTSRPEDYGYLSMSDVSGIILKQLYYDTWDGILPTVIADGSGIIISP